MKCRGKLHEIFRVVSGFPCYISCYIMESRLPLGQFIRIYSPSLLDKITDDDPPVAKYILTDVLTGDYCAMADCD